MNKNEKRAINKRRRTLTQQIFKLLPNLHKPKADAKTRSDSYINDHIEIWVESLSTNELGYWNFLNKSEQKTYIWEKSELGKFFEKKKKKFLKNKTRIKKVIKKKKEDPVEIQKTLKVIEKSIDKSKDTAWDYKKTDWDVT